MGDEELQLHTTFDGNNENGNTISGKETTSNNNNNNHSVDINSSSQHPEQQLMDENNVDLYNSLNHPNTSVLETIGGDNNDDQSLHNTKNGNATDSENENECETEVNNNNGGNNARIFAIQFIPYLIWCLLTERDIFDKFFDIGSDSNLYEQSHPNHVLNKDENGKDTRSGTSVTTGLTSGPSAMASTFSFVSALSARIGTESSQPSSLTMNISGEASLFTEWYNW